MSSDATSSPSRHISSAHDMGDSFELSTLQSLLEDAVNDYEKKVETSLIENQVAFRLRSCDTIESVTEVLEERAQAFRGFLGNDRHPKIMTSIRRIVHVLYTVLTGPGSTLGGGIVQVGHGISSVSVPPVKLIMSAIGILLTTVKDVNASYESLLELFESLGNFIQRLDIYTKIPPTTAMTRIVVKIIIELLSALALATKQIKEEKFFMKGLGENELETALRKLDRLTQDEARSATAQTLGVVSLLEKNMRMVMGGETSQAIKGKREQMRRDLQRWLSPPDPWKNHNIACDAHHKGTATWFIQGDTFSKWKASGSLLWICGKRRPAPERRPSASSTIIEAIDGIRRSGLASLGFFYCDFRDDEKRNRRGLLSSLLIQLCDQSKFYAEIIYNLYSEHRDGSQDPSDAALAQCLKDVIRCVGKPPIYIILDALDECPNAHGTPSPRGKVLMLVEDLVSLHIPNLRICITSRPETDIETTLDRLKFHPVSLHDEEGQIQDIENYIISVVNSDARMGKWRADDKELVVGTLSRKANGMFRWVSCQIDFLRRCLPARIRRALDELPETLNETYERTLEDIDEANWEYAHRLFQCITVASRPFCVEEFAEFLVFDFEAGQIPTLVEDWRPEDPIRAVLSTCSSLITIVEDSQEVQFSHFSVKEFLISSRLAAQVPRISRYHILMTPAHTTVAHACLSALLHLDENISEDSLKDFPLAQYAAEHWMDHAQLDRDNVPLSVKAGIRLLFDPRKPHFTVWMWIFNPDSPPLWQRPQSS
ncbi:hypothetical protein BGW80DRAFT_1449133 [Lactifluus volemus]|nr:hypothetical protein BGW80DRAFT_1449133 [Lactifluus volemus]